MKILITGANGSIGSDLVKYFSKKNKVYAFYRTQNFIVNKLKGKNINWIQQDLKNKLKTKIYPDLIIHSAITHDFAKKNLYQDYINSNIIGLRNIIDFANTNKVKHFIYFSSFKVYGDVKKKILTENNLFINQTLLGATKFLSEKIIEEQKFKYLIIRLPGVLSYLNSDVRRPWINTIINNLKKNKKINVFNSKTLFNNFIDTSEIAKFIEHLISEKLFNNNTINLSASKPIQLKKIIIFLKDKLKSKSKIIYNKKKTDNYYISDTKIKKIFKYKTLGALESLKKILD
tara:strand:- start:412 stop:1275 length:864 start_codon:yes stop_codon:yes gene_type:complete